MKKVYAIIDGRISEKCERSLVSLGFSVIKLKKFDHLPPPIASHTDMLLLRLAGNLFLSKAYFNSLSSEDKEFFSSLPIILTEETQKEGYPFDAIFNALVLEKRIFCKSDSFSKSAKEFLKGKGYEIVNVKQGYPACTALKISESAVITADSGMESALKREGIQVLKTVVGGVMLPPYEYGFIGGAAGIYGDKVYFLGDISTHPDAERIAEFIKENGLTPISLSDEPLADLGGILFIEENV